MTFRLKQISCAIGVLVVLGAGLSAVWYPAASRSLAQLRQAYVTSAGNPGGNHLDDDQDYHDPHDDHDHDSPSHPGHDEANALEISKEAKQTIGLKVVRVELKPFERSIIVPAMVVERPGRSVVRVTAPLTGVVSVIEAVKGEAVNVGQPLFTVRLTHEELVQAQSELLRSLSELDVAERELQRLEPLVEEKLIARKTFLDREYEKHKLEAIVAAGRQALALHGLSEEQIAHVVEGRELFRNLTVAVPTATRGSASPKQLYQVQELLVEQGQHVAAGDQLCVLTDHAELYIEGTAFEQDARQIDRAIADDAKLTAAFETGEEHPDFLPGLEILYSADTIDTQSRTLHFYARLPNELTRDSGADGEHRFISWKYKPGQRLKLQIPVETWRKSIVLPVDAVVADGPESFVFVRFGDHFDRRAVRIDYRDPYSVVVANDGSLRLGDMVAASGAEQLQLALKNKSGGGIDPHAGHNH